MIENNKQRNKLLEEMAEEIYKEWFVRLRFPNHENTEFVDSLPLVWEEIGIKNAFEIMDGGTPSTVESEFWKDGNINWFSPTDITNSKNLFLNDSSKQISSLGLAKSAAKIFPSKSVLMTSRATIGAVGINLKESSTIQGFITCIPNEHFSYPYIFEWIKFNKDTIISFSSGVTFKEISRGVFKTLKILKPELQISRK